MVGRRFLSFESLDVKVCALQLLEMATPLSAVLVALFLLAIALHWRCTKHHKDLPLPPGPKRWPLIGGLLQMPTTFEWETYREWSQQYRNYSSSL
jgi:hypothetical protein